MKTNILISIKRPWSDLILNDKKHIEIRKNIPRADVDSDITLWLYESGKDGARKIIGNCRYFGYGNVWSKTAKSAVEWVAIEAFLDKNYLASLTPCFGWLIGDPKRLPHAVPLSSIGLIRPPQSWQYLTPEQADILERRQA